MTDNDIDTMIERVADDGRHLRQLADGMELHIFCVRRRRVVTAVAVAVMIGLPTLYAAVLPSPEGVQVACNMQGADDEVMNCARQIFRV